MFDNIAIWGKWGDNLDVPIAQGIRNVRPHLTVT